MTVALFDCPTCIDSFAFDWLKIRNLGFRWRVLVRCPGCGSTVAVTMKAYQVIQNCEPDKYKAGEIIEILPPDLNSTASPLDYKLRLELCFSSTERTGDRLH